MGSAASQAAKNEKYNLRKGKQDQASEFYCACKNGDLERVRNLFSTTDFIEINHLEPNGSTGLHAAAYFGHRDVVEFLLQHGVFRDQRNRYGLTAYEEAADDEIRALFHRPSDSERFSTSTTADAQRLFTFPDEAYSSDDAGDDDERPCGWVKGRNDEVTIQGTQAGYDVAKTMLSSCILRPVFIRIVRAANGDDSGMITNEEQAVQRLQQLIDEHVTPSHKEYPKACMLLSKYNRTRDIRHLLHLYTLETPFYRNLGKGPQASALLSPVLFKLDALRNRAFRGCSYRGLRMTYKDLRAYRWALQLNGSVLTTQSFSSSSVDKEKAVEFMERATVGEVRVLMVLNFAEKCDTAIRLFALTKNRRSISEFENEHEVLILPYTSFRVTNIDIDKVTGLRTIFLENVPTKRGVLGILRCLRKNRQTS